VAPTLFVAVGAGTNCLAYSRDGINWTCLGHGIVSIGIGIAWNGTRWVAVGQGTNTLAYSSDDGQTWTGLGNNIFSSKVYSIASNIIF